MRANCVDSGYRRDRSTSSVQRELQTDKHKSAIVLERINAFYGYRAVDRLKLVQGPLPEPRKDRQKEIRELSRAESTVVEQKTASTRNADLRDALRRLGVSMLRHGDKPLKSDDSVY